MAVMRAAVSLVATLLAATLVTAAPAQGQSLSAEVVQTVGHTTDESTAAATQVRVFGDAFSGVRFTAEGAWAKRTGGEETDAFGAAYPYEDVKLMEAYADRHFHPGKGLVVVRAGRFRTPFGIHSASDYAYTGFLRAPLIRYDNYFALSNNFLENGVSVIAGVPRLFVQATAGLPGDVGEAVRRSGLDRVVRGQASYGPLTLGVSNYSSKPYMSPLFARGRTTFTGVDVRWMQGGVALKGEWLAGKPFDGTTTSGGYVDLMVHRPGLGPVTAVARAERLDYATVSPYAMYAVRYSAGGRIRVLDALAVQVNAIRQSGIPGQGRNALDMAVTYVLRFDSTPSR
jgi:hypothetical protein